MSASESQPAVQARGLVKSFGDVRALDGVDIDVPAGTVLGLLGPERRGEDHRRAHPLDRPRAGCRPGQRDGPGRGARRAAWCARRIGLAGQYAAVDGNLTGRENLRLIGALTHLPRRAIGPRADELLEQFGLSRRRATGRRAPTPAACGGASTWRPPSSTAPRSCSWTSPPRASTRPAAATSGTRSRGLVADGTTVLLTTQYLEEADRLADRIVVIDRGGRPRRGHRRRAEAPPGRHRPRAGRSGRRGRRNGRRASSTGWSWGEVVLDGRALRVSVSDGTRAADRRRAGARRRRHRAGRPRPCASPPSTTCSWPSPAGGPSPRPTRPARPPTCAAARRRSWHEHHRHPHPAPHRRERPGARALRRVATSSP